VLNSVKGDNYNGEMFMTSMRRDESESTPRFRVSRFFHSMDKWYFITREGTVEGPFEHRGEAEQILETYLNGLDGAVH
jgi:hypothetical protein